MMKTTLAAALFVGLGVSVPAVPSLQLDVLGLHHYDTGTETVIADDNPFTVRALLDGSTGLDRTYYLSAAITPDPGQSPNRDFGTFKIGATDFSSSAGMQYGYAPIEATAVRTGQFDAQDLQRHGIFPTWFGQVGFNIITAQTVPAYNTQDGGTARGSLYYVDFLVTLDSSFNDGTYAVHFDLYDTVVRGNGDVDVQDNAPFSHDAQSGHGIIVRHSPLPEGGLTVVLLGLVLGGLALVRRKAA